ncbi:LOW QUALITY PROTEIN: stabilizer of axonemal microtubules 4 [Phalacrocorax carbo]|uniref:LOW QUALITY PROTEIN: stabilizer of axonemal microtubules 4 n=1 Tax=Phalacrocorax carbo TaxID=9209 RepID=UPI003119CFCA
MAAACLFVCPRAKLRSLPRGSPAAGLGTGSPTAKARTGGSADLMNFYATSYAVAYGQLRFRPRLGHHGGTGYVSNNHSAVSWLLCPRGAAAGRCHDTATSTSAEHFKPFWLPDGRSLLPRHVHRPESRYLHGCPLSCLRTRAVSPQHTQLFQGPPKASGEHGTESRHAGPAQAGWAGDRVGDSGTPSLPRLLPADVLQKMTVGTKEQSGFTRATPRRDGILPALLGQPVRPSPTRSPVPRQPLTPSAPQGTLFLSRSSALASPHRPMSILWQGSETLPVLQAGSERGRGFSREVPGCLGMGVSKTPSHCLSPCALPILTCWSHAGLARGGPPPPTRFPRAAHTPSDPGQPAGTAGCRQEGGYRHDPVLIPIGPCTQPPSTPQEPSGSIANHGPYVPPHSTLSPTAPASPPHPAWVFQPGVRRDPTWMARPTGDIQPQRPSGFGTNNCPTGLGETLSHPTELGESLATPRHSLPQGGLR